MGNRKHNPIAAKLISVVSSGKTTWERICVATDLKYDTIKNVRSRDTISYITLKSLKLAGLINEKDEKDYNAWVMEHCPPKKRGRPYKTGKTGGRPPKKKKDKNPKSLVIGDA